MDDLVAAIAELLHALSAAEYLPSLQAAPDWQADLARLCSDQSMRALVARRLGPLRAAVAAGRAADAAAEIRKQPIGFRAPEGGKAKT